jgi:hypothetical protein
MYVCIFIYLKLEALVTNALSLVKRKLTKPHHLEYVQV